MAAKDPIWIVSAKYAAPSGELRNKQLAVRAADAEGAKKKASDSLALWDWYKIGTITKAD